MSNLLYSPAIVDAAGTVVVFAVFALIGAKLLLTRSFQDKVRSYVHGHFLPSFLNRLPHD